MKGKNIFCPVALGQELHDVNKSIAILETPLVGGKYPQPIPGVASRLRKYARELEDRIRLCSFPSLHPETN